MLYILSRPPSGSRPAPAKAESPDKWTNNRKRSRNPVVPSGTGGVLSNEQKARLCILSNRACALHGGGGTVAARDQYRHEQVHKATGKHGLTLCVQSDYKLIEAHFLNLIGESGQSLNAHLAHESEPRRVAMHKLEEALGEIGKPPAYAAAICRSQNKCELSQATAKQLWRLVFTIKNRGKSKHRGKAIPPISPIPPKDPDIEPF